MQAAEYYEKYEPRCDKLTGEKILFSNLQDYLKTDFASRDNMIKWLSSKANEEEARSYCVKLIKDRMKDKGLKYAPSFIELLTTDTLPPYQLFENLFGSYTKFCLELKEEPLFDDTVDLGGLKKSNPIVLIDTREQQPLFFENSEVQKLSIGDYTLAGDDYTYTYIDRKSEGDFKSTVTTGFDRFCKEIKRAEGMDCYIIVAVEGSIRSIISNNQVAAHQCNMKYVWSNMRKLHHLFPRRVQFVFTGNRKTSERLIPFLLRYGDRIWGVDIQNLLTKKGLV